MLSRYWLIGEALKRQVFDPITERDYQIARSLRALTLIRYGALVGLIVFLVSAPFEVYILDSVENRPVVWIATGMSSTAVAILGLLSYLNFFHTRAHFLVIASAVVISVNDCFYFSAYKNYAAFAFVLIQIVGFYILSVIAPNFITTLNCGLITVFLPLVLAYIFKLSEIILVDAYYYLALTVSVICIMSYFSDRRNRWAFQLELQLKADKQKLKELATRDSLTGCFNRRHFYEILEKEHQRAIRYGTPLSVLMIDIDHFKRINDSYGHAAGDKAICTVVKACQSMMRNTDTLARIGGEEFAIILSQTDRDGALIVAERLRSSVGEINLKFNDNETIRLTICLGVASLLNADQDPDSIIHHADEALYHAKRNGRNKVSTYQANTAHT